MKNMKILGVFVAFFAVLAVTIVASNAPVSAFNVKSSTGGDGYTPIIRKMGSGETHIFTIYHHMKPSGTATPEVNIYCVVASTSSTCPGYPKYFSSVTGTSNSGIDDIATSFFPHYATEGSQVYYAAQRATDNGVGCFDLEAGTNCGYTALGSLAMSTKNTRPASVDGLEQVGSKLYSFGKDIKAYCYDLSTDAACIGQPYTVAPGDVSMPAYDGDDLRLPRQAIGTNIYLVVNYASQSTPANGRLTCFDTLTNTRCAGWSGSVDNPGTNAGIGGVVEGIGSVFASYNTAGVANAVCAIGYGPNGPNCWNLTTAAPVTPLAGLLSGLSASWAREETRLGNKTYFAFFQGNGGFAECFDFTTQTRCAGFSSPRTWPGINGGNTGDYGYTYADAGCFFATGDDGILWSFDPITGATGDTSCPSASAAAAVIPSALPDAGIEPENSPWYILSLAIPLAIAAAVLGRRRVVNSKITN